MITNEGLHQVSQIGSLEVLSVGGKRITDAGLAHLKSLSKLKEISFHDVNLTHEGRMALQAELPLCNVR